MVHILLLRPECFDLYLKRKAGTLLVLKRNGIFLRHGWHQFRSYLMTDSPHYIILAHCYSDHHPLRLPSATTIILTTTDKMKVSSVFLPCCISIIAIATCPVQHTMAQHHHHHANNNNHQSNIDTTDIYSRSSEKTTADAIDTTLTFVDDADATDGKDGGQRNLIEVSSNEDVAEDDEEDDVSTIVNIWYMSV